MGYFDRKPENMKPLKFPVGMKVMGYEQGLGADMLVAGEIIKADQSTSHLSDNNYEVRLFPDTFVAKGRKDGLWFIDERNVLPYDERVFKEANEHWKKEWFLREQSWEEHVAMIQVLEEYTLKEAEKK